MTYYEQQIADIKKAHFSPDYVADRIIRARKWIAAHYCEIIDLDMIAHSCHLSKYHFARLFKKNYGKTPNKYVTELRLALAKKLLTEGRSVTETCFSVGFESPSSFSILFRRYYGLPPSSVKKQFSISALSVTSL